MIEMIFMKMMSFEEKKSSFCLNFSRKTCKKKDDFVCVIS